MKKTQPTRDEALRQEVKEVLTQNSSEWITVSTIVKETGALIGSVEEALLSLKREGIRFEFGSNTMEINGRTLIIFYPPIIPKNFEMDKMEGK